MDPYSNSADPGSPDDYCFWLRLCEKPTVLQFCMYRDKHFFPGVMLPQHFCKSHCITFASLFRILVFP